MPRPDNVIAGAGEEDTGLSYAIAEEEAESECPDLEDSDDESTLWEDVIANAPEEDGQPLEEQEYIEDSDDEPTIDPLQWDEMTYTENGIANLPAIAGD